MYRRQFLRHNLVLISSLCDVTLCQDSISRTREWQIVMFYCSPASSSGFTGIVMVNLCVGCRRFGNNSFSEYINLWWSWLFKSVYCFFFNKSLIWVAAVSKYYQLQRLDICSYRCLYIKCFIGWTMWLLMMRFILSNFRPPVLLLPSRIFDPFK